MDLQRCPDCAAVPAAGARWCPLCFRPLNADDPPAVRRDDAAADVQPPAVRRDDAPADADPLALLTSAVPATPGVFATPGGRVGVMVGGAMALVAILLILMWLVGSLLPTR